MTTAITALTRVLEKQTNLPYLTQMASPMDSQAKPGQKGTSSYSLPRRTHGPKIPPWMPVTFRPPEDMILTADELACAAYIFGPDLKSETTKGEKMLVSTITSYVNRESLNSLVPGEQVHQEVIDCLAYMLTQDHKKLVKLPTIWFLPTIFSQLALSWSRPPDQLQKQFADHYMDKVDNLSRVSDSHRMRLANLITKEFNVKKLEVMDKTHVYMKDIQQKDSQLQKD
ncbi:hypothetical protein PIB30_058143 [Stylosanthes scabra]|uniref:Uncharacterized protein n=1 Tax=Stylosanthes scabra TaxID=79078 RepID=A0ABU6XHU7_9FABA|nr:hypothetical protein [Stylosanthes scabra]